MRVEAQNGPIPHWMVYTAGPSVRSVLVRRVQEGVLRQGSMARVVQGRVHHLLLHRPGYTTPALPRVHQGRPCATRVVQGRLCATRVVQDVLSVTEAGQDVLSVTEAAWRSSKTEASLAVIKDGSGPGRHSGLRSGPGRHSGLRSGPECQESLPCAKEQECQESPLCAKMTTFVSFWDHFLTSYDLGVPCSERVQISDRIATFAQIATFVTFTRFPATQE